MMKSTKALILALALILVSTAAWAQRFELTPFVGYRTSGSFDGTYQDFTNFKVNGGMAFGLTFGYMVSPNILVEAMMSRLNSSLSAHGLEIVDTNLFDLTTDVYHLNFLFYFGNAEAKARPFILLGLGLLSANPKPAEIEGESFDAPAKTRFSWSLGAGLEAMFNRNVGVRVTAKWLPTYINSESAIWIDWWGNPWIVPVSNYMNQGEFTGGLVFRF